jgi:hypothetical protein
LNLFFIQIVTKIMIKHLNMFMWCYKKWWCRLFQKYHSILTEIHADIGNKHILSSYQKYLKSHGLQEFFKTGRIDMCPDIEEYI